jgi:hypothetical protein
MSLEAKIEALTQAVVALTAKLESANVAAPAPVAQAPAPVAAPAPLVQPVVAAPVSVTPTNPVSSQPAAPAMPAPPAFVAPAPAAPAASGAPFTDGKGLIDYVMGAYKALGPQKGAQIQGVLTGLGYQNINDVKPEHYGALFAGVEQLKA